MPITNIRAGLTEEEHKAIQDTNKLSRTAFYVSLASLIVAIIALIIAIWR